ncbi:MAG: DNA translocase FtsK 4TM domain-containing protein [Bacteroidales bacterium]|nr:DNA translocase FtsK 4TM domain-containing protein [Bacteroidales bacterium]
MSESSVSAFKFGIGIVLLVAGVLLFIAIVSFLFTGGADRSIFDLSLGELISNTDIEVRNPIGKVGAWLSDMLVTNGIGLMSLSVPYFIVVFGLWMLGLRAVSLLRQLGWCIGVSIWGSVALGFIFFKLSSRSYLLMGGMHGFYVSKWLSSAIGPVGAFCLIFVVLLLVLTTKVARLREGIMRLLSRMRVPGIKMPQIAFTDGREVEIDELRRKSDESVREVRGGDDEDDDDEDDEEGDDDDEQGNDEGGDKGRDGVGVVGVTIDRERSEEPERNERNEREIVGKPIEVTVGGDEEPDDKLRTIDITVGKDDEIDTTAVMGPTEKYDPTSDLAHYEFPTLDMLADHGSNVPQFSKEEVQANNDRIVQAFENFGIKIDQIKAIVGPTVTLYEVVQAPGVRINKIQALQDDIAQSLAAQGIRIIAPIPGRGVIGIEVPNADPQVVSMKSVLSSMKFQNSTYELPVAIGKTISNETFIFDLAKTPHLLVAGATGQGKSVGINAIITSLLYKKHPSQLKFVLVDPKMVEFSPYKVLEKFYLAKMESEEAAVITDMSKARATLESLTVEMDDRYKLLMDAKVRDIKEYNAKFIDRRLNPEKGHRYMPYIVVVVDEFADLFMTVGKEVEKPIARIAQKARAVGIHMILATQRPSANIITGVIKANFPSRIAFKVSQMVDSKTILDQSGAQHLAGKGDMLVQLAGDMAMQRVQCAYVDTDEVVSITEHIEHQVGYESAYMLPDCEVGEDGQVTGPVDMDPAKFDSIIKDVARMVVSSGNGSTSNIQRIFEIGYNRAGKITDQLERMGVVSPPTGPRKDRNVLVQTETELERIFTAFGL